MKSRREELLGDLEQAKAGLSPREYIEQSSSYVFRAGEVLTFNDEVACRKKIHIPREIEGAVQAASLLEALRKHDDEFLEILKNDDGELEFRGKRDRFAVTMDPTINLPIDKVERPGKWQKLSSQFTEAIGLVKDSVSKEEDTQFALSCVHVAPSFVEACDNKTLVRCNVKSDFLKESILVRGTSISPIVSLGMDLVSLTDNWIHFRQDTKEGDSLIYSCRRFSEEYRDMSQILDFEGDKFVLPKGLKDAAERAEVFASDNAHDPLIRIRLADGKMRLYGQGLTGHYQGLRSATYSGPEVDFFIAPAQLKYIADKYEEAEVTPRRLMVRGGNWRFVTNLISPESREKAEQESPKRKKQAESEDDGAE